MTERLTFTLPLSPEPADIDELGHVNNTVYLRWCQEAATTHWKALAPPADQERWIWVVLRHEIDYKAAAFLETPLEAVTWVGEAKGARFDRHVQIRRADTAQVCAEAKTTWAMLDRELRRPARVPAELIRLFGGG
jgi:acyl-CoA thioester hydrolase